MGLLSLASWRLKLEPIFGSKAWGANSTCDDVHPGGPIPEGERVCCMACHQTGVEGHPDLRETATGKLRLDNWKAPEGGDQWSEFDLAEPTRYEAPAKDATPTRKAKRARKFAGKLVYMDPRQLERLVDDGRARPCLPID